MFPLPVPLLDDPTMRMTGALGCMLQWMPLADRRRVPAKLLAFRTDGVCVAPNRGHDGAYPADRSRAHSPKTRCGLGSLRMLDSNAGSHSCVEVKDH